MSTIPTACGGYTTSYQTNCSTNKAAQADTVQEISNNSANDVVSISAEGLDAYTKADASGILQPTTYNLKQNNYSTELFSVEKNSKHFSPTAWALGIDVSGMSFRDANTIMFNAQGVESIRAQLQATTERIDGKITDILKANNIVLGEDETLNLSVNQHGVITVGKGVSDDKRAALEKLLNEDKTLGQDLLMSHAQRQTANIATGASDANSKAILANTILQREYGVSLSDLQLPGIDANGDWENGGWITTKDGDSSFMEQLYNEENALYNYIHTALSGQGASGSSGGFEYSYSYKNGVTVEKGQSDQAGLDKTKEAMFTRQPFFRNSLNNGTFGYSISIDTDGNVLDASVNSYKGHTDQKVLVDQSKNLRDYFSSANTSHWNPFASQSTLQQFAFDTDRLMQFNFGADSEKSQTLGITFGKLV